MGFLQGADSGPSLADNEVLDEFTIPFGQWFEQAINWTVLELEWLLDIVEWPFSFLLDNVVDNVLIAAPWWAVTLVMVAIALLVRNVTVAVGTGLGLIVCGLLGQQYWEQTARTIGLVGVAVLLCVLIGIPIGIIAGRVDSFWGVLRPTLDAMQVIHSFVYLLPFIYFFGIGEVGATMATMIFAVPPLIRLTNLGIRQVPEDVVEAARAYGAPELKVLVDVQRRQPVPAAGILDARCRRHHGCRRTRPAPVPGDRSAGRGARCVGWSGVLHPGGDDGPDRPALRWCQSQPGVSHRLCVACAKRSGDPARGPRLQRRGGGRRR
jgi:glycine betaine/proline transport system permease protein